MLTGRTDKLQIQPADARWLVRASHSSSCFDDSYRRQTACSGVLMHQKCRAARHQGTSTLTPNVALEKPLAAGSTGKWPTCRQAATHSECIKINAYNVKIVTRTWSLHVTRTAEEVGHVITNHASRLVFRNDPEIKWPPQSMYYA